MLAAGSHIISVNDVYGGTYRYFTKVASTNGVDVSFVDMYDPVNVEKAWKPNTRMVWMETPST
jgi:cystathionine gamma-lyase